MIIDFTIKNFRSIKDEQLFSMNAEKPGNHLLENIAMPDGKTAVLKTAAIYGANASGKSNLLKALDALRMIIVDSGSLKEGQAIPAFDPFRLEDDNKRKPVEFEIEFVDQTKTRFKYRVVFNSSEILEEVLDFFPGRAKANVFTRLPGDTWENVRFGSKYKAKNKRIPFFANNSYLSKAGNNAAGASMLRSVFRYFNSIIEISPQHRFIVTDMWDEDARLELISNLLCKFDTGISRVSREENSGKRISLPDDMPENIKNALIETNKFDFKFWHKKNNGEYEKFSEELESTGTLRLLNLLPIIVDCIADGRVLLIDELDNSFHPHIAELVVRLFNDPDVNINNAQLIFTTHDMSLMSANHMRRDQLWFVNKLNGVTTLYSLDEFDKKKVTPNSPFSNWYHEGRFGGVPDLKYGELVGGFGEYRSRKLKLKSGGQDA